MTKTAAKNAAVFVLGVFIQERGNNFIKPGGLRHSLCEQRPEEITEKLLKKYKKSIYPELPKDKIMEILVKCITKGVYSSMHELER